jgi:hypothetical protein
MSSVWAFLFHAALNVYMFFRDASFAKRIIVFLASISAALLIGFLAS